MLSTRMSAGILGKEFCNYCMSTKRCFVFPLLLFSLKLATTMLCQMLCQCTIEPSEG
jgi:hypothetical protein